MEEYLDSESGTGDEEEDEEEEDSLEFELPQGELQDPYRWSKIFLL